jgi:beta-N-acetylglucosaminidase
MTNYVEIARRTLEAMPRSPEGNEQDASGIPWAEWRAADLNRLFKEHGTSGQPGRITAATIRHGASEKKLGID